MASLPTAREGCLPLFAYGSYCNHTTPSMCLATRRDRIVVMTVTYLDWLSINNTDLDD